MRPILVGIDRDGTLHNDVGYLGRETDWAGQLELCEGVIEGIKLLNRNDLIKIIVATNQAGVARGFFGTERIEEVNRAIDSMLSSQYARIHNWQYCPFVTPEYAVEKKIPKDSKWVRKMSEFYGLRKPGTGMLKKAAEELGHYLNGFEEIYFIGDKTDDVKTGINAGGIGILLSPDKEKAKDIMVDETRRIVVASNFYNACKWVMEDLQNKQ